MKNPLKITVAAALLAVATSLHATTVNYELTSLGANQWKYSYSVANDSSPDPLTDLLVFFPEASSPDALNYTLGAMTSPVGWAPFAGSPTQPSAIDLGGYAEWTGAGIPAGGTLGGFEIEFTYTGTQPLGRQTFQVYDDNFNLLDENQTARATPSGVPDHSGGFVCALIGLACIGGLRGKLNRAQA